MKNDWRWWWTAAIYAALAVAWTGPAAVSGDLVGRHFDVPGTAWFVDRAHEFGFGGRDPQSAWPLGGRYGRLDSFVLVVVSYAAPLVGTARVHGLCQVIGVAGSAWAAEAFARAIGARPPWSLLAGLSFGFGGLAATALLEGHVYHVMDPWLPLFALAWWRAVGVGGKGWHGLAAGACWTLCLLTTAYLGVVASVVALGFLSGAALRRSLRALPAIGAAAVVVPVGLIYVRHFRAAAPSGSGDAPLFGPDPTGALQVGAADLAGLLAPIPEVPGPCHGASPVLGAAVLALALVAPRVLADRPGWRAVLLTGAAGLLLSLGPWLTAGGTRLAPLPMAALAHLPGAELGFRFPMRLGWAWALCGGAVAALVATEIAAKSGRAALGLLALALGDAFLLVRLPARQAVQVSAVPSAYSSVEGPVLDLYPEHAGGPADWNLWFQGLACWYQTGHGRVIAEDCVGTNPAQNPRHRISRHIWKHLLAGNGLGAAEVLGALGVRAVAWHPDLFHQGDRDRIGRALAAIDPEPARSTDGGEHVAVYRVPIRAGAAPRNEYDALEWQY